MYYIYHIPGIKVGCTTRYDKRCYENRRIHGRDISIELLETVESIDQADERENDYSKMLGYGEISTKQRYKLIHKIGTYLKDKNHNWGDKIGVSLKNTLEDKDLTGANNSNYGTGILMKDLISGFVGYRNEIRKKFPGINVGQFLSRNRPVKRKDGVVVHLVKIDTPSL